MKTDAEWAAEAKDHSFKTTEAIVRAIQSDALRFAADHYAAAVSVNEAGMRLEELADAVLRGDYSACVVYRFESAIEPEQKEKK